MGNTESFLTINEIPSDAYQDDRWKQFNVEVGEHHGKSMIVSAKFPDGWTVRLNERDGRHAHYLDPKGIPRVSAFLKTAEYDPHCSTYFMSEEDSMSLYNEWRELNKVSNSLKQFMKKENTTDIVVYQYHDGRHRWDSYYAGYPMNQRTSKSEFDTHNLVGWFSDMETAQKIVEQLNLELKDRCNDFVVRDIREKPLDRFESIHLTGIDTQGLCKPCEPRIFKA